jgi:hypothetical protein
MISAGREATMNDELSKLLEQQADAKRADEMARVLEDVHGGYGDHRDY